MKNNMRAVSITILLFLCFSGIASAQVGGYGIPSTYAVAGENIESGDIVSFDPEIETRTLSRVATDENIFGVIDRFPVVVFRTADISRVPIVQVGEVQVNVTTLGGPIVAGDRVTTSVIPGKGQRYEGGGGYILGYALESFRGTESTTTLSFSGGEVSVGQIRVLLSIGPSGSVSEEPLAPATIFVRDGGSVDSSLETVFRYITAALFALGTIFVALKTFGPNIGKGVVSIGRNPLAKSSIQAMVIFNIILILAISAVSFIVSLLIIFLPI